MSISYAPVTVDVTVTVYPSSLAHIEAVHVWLLAMAESGILDVDTRLCHESFNITAAMLDCPALQDRSPPRRVIPLHYYANSHT